MHPGWSQGGLSPWRAEQKGRGRDEGTQKLGAETKRRRDTEADPQGCSRAELVTQQAGAESRVTVPPLPPQDLAWVESRPFTPLPLPLLLNCVWETQDCSSKCVGSGIRLTGILTLIALPCGGPISEPRFPHPSNGYCEDSVGSHIPVNIWHIVGSMSTVMTRLPLPLPLTGWPCSSSSCPKAPTSFFLT